MTRGATSPEGIAAAIVRLPSTLRAGGGESIYDLVASTGYFDHMGVGESVIRKRLTGAPELVDEWLAYSEDKRSESGWYFRIVPHQGYEVGRWGGATAQHSCTVHADRFDACAKFIKQELESIREL